MSSPEVKNPINASSPAHSDQNNKQILRYDQFFNTSTHATTYNKTKPHKQRKNRAVIIVRRIMNYKGQHVDTEVDIKSPGLCAVLLDIHKDVDGLTLNGPAIASTELLYHSRDGLQQRLVAEKQNISRDNCDTSTVQLVADIETALQFIHEDHAQTAETVKHMCHLGKEITFDLLWTLFAPNILLYHYHVSTEQPQILLCRRFNYGIKDSKKIALVFCFVITNDGQSFGVALDVFELDAFVGTQKIRNLKLYPLEYHDSANELRDRALSRGKKFVAMQKRPFSYYNIPGPAMQEEIDKNEEVKKIKFRTYGRVMIDHAAFRRFEPNRYFNLSVERQLDHDSLDDVQYMLCTPIILGYSFGVKKWGGFAMDRVSEIKWSDGLFESLVLAEHKKSVISALIRKHFERASQSDDVIRGKGKGLVFLLSGGPGCGKTLTAEAIAEKTNRPLYVVSAGELGTTPESVEEHLTSALQLAQTWKAILLIDEADVFLQKRDFRDATRNALVSIFLRQIEYYQGILILTTNLASHIDSAFQSRIQFPIHYPDLDFAARKRLWAMFVEESQGTVDSNITTEDYDQLAKRSLNGREIKNVVTNAQSLAMDEDLPLSMDIITRVLKALDEWKSANDLGGAREGHDVIANQAGSSSSEMLVTRNGRFTEMTRLINHDGLLQRSDYRHIVTMVDQNVGFLLRTICLHLILQVFVRLLSALAHRACLIWSIIRSYGAAKL